MSSTEGPQGEGAEGFAPSPAWREAFEQQYSDELVQRLEIFAAQRLAGIGNRARRGNEQQAREIVASAVFDTLRGLVRWHPERKDLELHFKDVIKRRTSLDWTRAKNVREESIDTTNADGRSPVLEEVESVLLERFPDPVATEKAARALAEIAQIAEADADFAAFIEARADGLRARAVMRATGLSPERYRRCRRQLGHILDRLSIHVRPWRRKRGHHS